MEKHRRGGNKQGSLEKFHDQKMEPNAFIRYDDENEKGGVGSESSKVSKKAAGTFEFPERFHQEYA
uniref:Uncharacterized protein n=1 Tax=Setaria digitata TaxID=48799 RepID=A0A915PT66_9BILA